MRPTNKKASLTCLLCLLLDCLGSPSAAGPQEVEPDVPSVQPFCLEDEEPPAAPSSSPPLTDQSGSTDPGAPSQGESEPSRNLIELETTEETNKTTQEVNTKFFCQVKKLRTECRFHFLPHLTEKSQ